MKRLAALLVAIGALVAAAPAPAARHMSVGIADDRVLLAGGLLADKAVAEWKRLGVDDVRILAQWSRIAPKRGSLHPPSGFDAHDPASTGYHWETLDAAVDRVTQAGMRVVLTITGPGPLWASSAPRRHNRRWSPRPSAYGDFAAAVAARYADVVDEYILYNEPNLPAWLQPQSACSHGHCSPRSPHIYRSLVRAAYPAIHAVVPDAKVLVGALAPRGSNGHSNNATLKPMSFIRAMGCVDRGLHRLHTGRCRNFRPLTADGFAYHPHSVVLPPFRPFPDPDDVDLASLGRLEGLLDRLQARGRMRPTTRKFNLYLDEFGYQTNPPDKILGVSPATQDRWLQEAVYRAWRDPRVKLFTQYGWRDEPVSPNGLYSGWQAGLRYANLKPKPSLLHFARTVESAHGTRPWSRAAKSRR
jgi:hypothetical protein